MIKYIKNHIVVQINIVFLLTFLFIVLLFQNYLKQQYYVYLTEKQYLMEEAVLENAKNNLDIMLMEYINIGAEISVSKEICSLAEKYERDPSAGNYLNLQSVLKPSGRKENTPISVSIVNGEGIVFQYSRYPAHLWNEENHSILMKMYSRMQQILQTDTMPRYVIGTEPIRYPGNYEIENFHMFFPMIGEHRNLDKVHMMLCLSFDMEIMYQFVDSLDTTSLNYLYAYVTDENGIIIAHKDKNNLGMLEADYLQREELTKMNQNLSNAGWSLNIAFDENKSVFYVNEIYRSGVKVYILLIIVVLLLLCWMLSKIIEPVNRIRKEMTDAVNERERKAIQIEGRHEIWQLAQAYNDMIKALQVKQDEVEYYYEELLKSVKCKYEAEREALESQINGHFICNTLNVINYEMIEEGNYKASVLIKKLSNILRYSFSQKVQNIYLGQEIAWTEQYLFLMKARLENVFDYEVHIDEKLGNVPCCKLMFQPFVENAIIHGFEGREEGGRLQIECIYKDDCICVTIRDNGHGMDEEKAEKIRLILEGRENENCSEIGFGIRNVNSRLKLYYGEALKILLDTRPGSGTVFILKLPYLKKPLFTEEII